MASDWNALATFAEMAARKLSGAARLLLAGNCTCTEILSLRGYPRSRMTMIGQCMRSQIVRSNWGVIQGANGWMSCHAWQEKPASLMPLRPSERTCMLTTCPAAVSRRPLLVPWLRTRTSPDATPAAAAIAAVNLQAKLSLNWQGHQKRHKVDAACRQWSRCELSKAPERVR